MASGGAFNAAGGAPGTGGQGQEQLGSGGVLVIASGGQASGGSNAGSGGGSPSGGADSAGSGGATSGTGLGYGMMEGEGESAERYATAFVSRNEVPYILITNGWGPGFTSHTVSWSGTSFIVKTTEGSAGSNGQPASYPSLFCGRYSVPEVPDCGLPAPIASLSSLKTGWRWAQNGSPGQYNAAYDIWLGNGSQFSQYLMVWLHDPDDYQPAGAPTEHLGVTVEGLPGVWDIWSGTVNNRPIINWVKAKGDEIEEIEFDVLSLLADAQVRNLSVTGDQVNAVAVGFEIWEGPVSNLETKDFYVDVQAN